MSVQIYHYDPSMCDAIHIPPTCCLFSATAASKKSQSWLLESVNEEAPKLAHDASVVLHLQTGSDSWG